ncbi:MAG: phosphatidylserine decarboxylase family protein [Deltaproteobacteria bacterium]|nr:phosphatidylserine decarboxylase family protein [Deltaproteobacteria bacterium]
MKRIPVAGEAKRLLLPLLAIFLISFFLGQKILSILSFIFAIFVLYFFRDPERFTDLDKNFILSPADGKVLNLETKDYKDFELERCYVISIFMSPLDVHVNRSPCDGEILTVQHEPGRYYGAFKHGVEKTNERNYILLKDGDKKILVIQIAGFLARRIFCYVRKGMKVSRGQRIGMIAFGSRVDVCLPPDYDIIVRKGEKVKAGITPIAKRSGGL